MPGNWSATAGVLGAGTDAEVEGAAMLRAEVPAGGGDVGVAAPAGAALGAPEQPVSASTAVTASTVRLTLISGSSCGLGTATPPVIPGVTRPDPLRRGATASDRARSVQSVACPVRSDAWKPGPVSSTDGASWVPGC